MIFSRTYTFLLFFLTFGLFATASPAKRDNADIQAVFTTLKGQTDSILPQFGALLAAGNATDDTVTPIFNELTSALDAASASLGGLAVPVSLFRRQSDDDIANLVAGIISDIANALDGLLGSAATIPGLGGLLGGVDTSLNQVLLGLKILLEGVLHLVANLLVDVAGLLNSLALGLSTSTLGL